MALAGLTGLTMAVMAARANRINDLPPRIPLQAEKVAGYPPKDKYPDPNKFGYASQLRLKNPSVARMDQDYMNQRGRDFLIGDPTLRRIYQQHVYTHSRNGLGDGRLKDKYFCGNNNRFGPTQLRRLQELTTGILNLREQEGYNLKGKYD